MPEMLSFMIRYKILMSISMHKKIKILSKASKR